MPIAALALVIAIPAHAQSFFFFPDEYGRTRAWENRDRETRRSPPRYSNWWDDYDDEDERPQRQRPLGPAKASGGPRPDISPSAPPVVSFKSSYQPGSIVIDTRGRALYYVLPDNHAYRYRIAVGRQGFSWVGTEKISRKVAWPDWRPPAEMRQRDPRLPELMTGGLRNPLGAKALYLGNTLYRIHGTNNARSIGTASSSGCFRMTNANVMHLASIAQVGAQVHVLRSLPASVRHSIASGSDEEDGSRQRRSRDRS
ncbi:MAG: L,D-transpeptidase [Hyphomicrobiaceae bacterium]